MNNKNKIKINDPELYIYRDAGLGDSLVILPALKKIYEKYNKKIILITSKSLKPTAKINTFDVLKHSDFIEKALYFDPDDFFSKISLLKKIRKSHKNKILYYFAYTDVPFFKSVPDTAVKMAFFKLCGFKKVIGWKEAINDRKRYITPDTVENEYSRYLRIASDKSDSIAENPLPPFLNTKAAEETADKIFISNNLNKYKLNNSNNSKIICIGIGSLYPVNRQFNKKYPELISLIVAKYTNVSFILLGGKEDFEEGESIKKLFPSGIVINLAGKTSIIESAVILEKADLYIGNDTGTTHLAAIVGCPVISIFSARDRKEKYNPYKHSNTVVVIRKEIPCEGCNLKECAERKTECINSIETAEVFESAVNILKYDRYNQNNQGICQNNSIKNKNYENTNKTERINRILIDCSETYIDGLNTGIQRVVRNITERSDRISKKINIPVIPIVLDNKEGYISLDAFIKNKNGNELNKTKLKKSDNDISEKVKEKIKIILKERFNINENQKIFHFLKSGWRTLKRFKYFLIGLRLKYRLHGLYKLSNNNIIKNIIKPETGDLLLLPDGFWGYRYNYFFYDFCKGIKRKNGKIASIFHDITPLTNPEFFEDDLIFRFKRAIKKFNDLIDAIITISKSEMGIIKDYFGSNSNAGFNINSKALYFFYLGYDFDKKICNETNSFGHIVNENLFNLVRNLKNNNIRIYLTVGTIEPRKGYSYTVNAFEYLWKNGFNGVLFIVGRIGWNVDGFIKKINSSDYINKKLYVINDAKDADLTFLYKSANAVICPSFREGYGLPLLEAMHCGIPVLASDIPVFREVGENVLKHCGSIGNYPIYFKPDAEHLIKAIKEFENIENTICETSETSEINCNTWDDSADMLADIISDIIK